jgi:hypothetical protein
MSIADRITTIIPRALLPLFISFTLSITRNISKTSVITKKKMFRIINAELVNEEYIVSEEDIIFESALNRMVMKNSQSNLFSCNFNFISYCGGRGI